jgi:hypothetical protein
MKFKRTVLLATFVVTMGLLLGTSAAQEPPEVISDGNVAFGILNLPVAGVLYNVAFVQNSPSELYGDPPGFDFPLDDAARAAAQAVRDALAQKPEVTRVGPPGGSESPISIIGFSEAEIELSDIRFVWVRELQYIEEGADQEWIVATDPDVKAFEKTYIIADFSVVPGTTPDPVKISGDVIGLEGSGLVLSNGSENLPIDGDGPFEFPTPLTPGTFYNVTVATPPSNPAQTCSVENGGGQVPTEDVTDVFVDCAAAVLGDVSKVAAEGDTLPGDTTLLTHINLDGGVAINASGQVAFHGKTAGTETASIDAVFTQDRLVVQVGPELPDGTTLTKIHANGKVAINVNGKVAFHGKDDAGVGGTDAVFTQDRLVVKEGDPGSLNVDDIRYEGKVAINDLDEVAFHGQIEIEGGLFDEWLPAVFTSDGQVLQEDSVLPDGTIVVEIEESGGVAFNAFGQVAFHGTAFDPDLGIDAVEAVFTSDGLVAMVGSELPVDSLSEGTTVAEINVDGGVAINSSGKVAFLGKPLDPDLSINVQAVFTQDGLVVKEGDKLPDGTIVVEINVDGGVAINDFDKVAFHGKAVDPDLGGDAVKAVFTQDGLVARKDENLTDNTTLSEISEKGGVAINNAGQVAFHGKVGTTAAVFVGLSPVPAAKGEALVADPDAPVEDGEEVSTE